MRNNQHSQGQEKQPIILDREAQEPLYQQLEKAIKLNITSGTWPQGFQLPTYRQLAENTGVSMITVQQAIDNLVSQNFLYRRQGQGTFVATQDSKIGSNRIGLFLPNLREPFFSFLAQIIQTEAINDGYTISIFSYDDGTTLIAKAVEIMSEQNVDAFITTPSSNHDALDHVLSIRGRGVPVVIVDGHLENEAISCIECDNRLGMAMILDHLIALGHRRIGFASGQCYTSGLRSRMEAFNEVVPERGLELNPSYLQISHLDRDEGGWDAAHKLLMLREPPTAIACSTDIVAAGVLRAAKSMNIKVPEQLSIVGYDDMYLATHLEVPLTTIKQPVEKIAQMAVKKLISYIGNTTDMRHESIILSPELVLRSSTGPAPVS